jgi:hypothetical protein
LVDLAVLILDGKGEDYYLVSLVALAFLVWWGNFVRLPAAVGNEQFAFLIEAEGLYAGDGEVQGIVGQGEAGFDRPYVKSSLKDIIEIGDLSLVGVVLGVDVTAYHLPVGIDGNGGKGDGDFSVIEPGNHRPAFPAKGSVAARYLGKGYREVVGRDYLPGFQGRDGLLRLRAGITPHWASRALSSGGRVRLKVAPYTVCPAMQALPTRYC